MRQRLRCVALILFFIVGTFGSSYVNNAASIDWETYFVNDEYTYNGKVRTPEVVVNMYSDDYNKYYCSDDTEMEYDDDYDDYVELDDSQYKIKYSKGRKNVGKYTAEVILPTGNKKTISFKINPKPTKIKKLNSTSNSITVKWSINKKQITGYQIKYAKKKSLSGAKTVNIKKYKTNSKKITKLKSNTNYYFSIRTYKVVSGKKFYSDWSTVKRVKTIKKSDDSTDTASTPTKQTPSTSDSGMVWIPKSGTKYHKTSTCSGMRNPSQVTKEYAESMGYTPCSKCY